MWQEIYQNKEKQQKEENFPEKQTAVKNRTPSKEQENEKEDR